MHLDRCSMLGIPRKIASTARRGHVVSVSDRPDMNEVGVRLPPPESKLRRRSFAGGSGGDHEGVLRKDESDFRTNVPRRALVGLVGVVP